jgi:hypothetical protein
MSVRAFPPYCIACQFGCYCGLQDYIYHLVGGRRPAWCRCPSCTLDGCFMGLVCCVTVSECVSGSCAGPWFTVCGHGGCRALSLLYVKCARSSGEICGLYQCKAVVFVREVLMFFTGVCCVSCCMSSERTQFCRCHWEKSLPQFVREPPCVLYCPVRQPAEGIMCYERPETCAVVYN